MADYGDILLEAVQTVVDGSLSKLAFDKTITATITSNANAKKGEYTVNDGSTSFLAYSENTEYLNGTAVYINIPNGDFTKQKTITGKYLAAASDYYTYSSPWNKYVDITGNLLPEDALLSITANGSEKTTTTQELTQYKISDAKEYDCIGLRVNFKTLLNSVGTEIGTYGLRLYIRTINKVNSSTVNPYKTYVAELSTLDMIGNPYNFESYYSQEKVFDISGMGEIYSISIALFQNGDFCDGTGKLIPVDSLYGQEIKNIFANNIYISLGYNLETFSGNQAWLYSLDSETYDASYGKGGEENQKTLKLRWVHEDEDGNIVCYTDMSRIGESARIHWYKYKLDSNVSDELAGAFWEEIPEWQDSFENNINCFDYVAEQNIQYKVVIETPVKEYLLRDSIQDQSLNTAISLLEQARFELDNALTDYENAPSEFTFSAKEEAQVLYDNRLDEYNTLTEAYIAEVSLLESNVLMFSNEREVESLATLDLIQALTLDIDPTGYRGIYTLYDETNNIQNPKEANIIRTITANYKSTVTGDTDLDSAESIMWQFPLVNTMIHAPELGKEIDDTDEVTYTDDGQYCIITRNAENVAGTIGKSFEHATEQYFRIKDYYMASATNNTITCYVTKNQKVYQAVANLSFGPLGNNGTDFTFIARMESGRTCLYGTDNDPLEINVSLYDFNNDEVPHNQNAEIFYSWYAKDKITKVGFCASNGNLYDKDKNEILGPDLTGISLLEKYIPEVDNEDNHMHCYIRRLTDDEILTLNDLAEVTDEDRIPYYYILRVESTINANSDTKNVGEVLLNTYLSIPYAQNYDYTQIEGADKIVYDTSGANCLFYKKGYVLYSGNERIEDVYWDEKNDASTIEERKYYPKVDEDGTLIPPSTYVSDLNPNIAAVAYNSINNNVLWSQPIVLYQNAYSSNMLNSWDGSLTIDEEKGTIMSTMLGAGSKDKKNRFNGVLIGDVKSTADTSASTGVFGYHEGVQSFGLKTDGTAFMGKVGKGQIKFDGNSGLIQSLSYEKNKTGMMINLDDGVIDMRGGEIETVLNKKTVSTISVADFTEDLNDIYFMLDGKRITTTPELSNAIKVLQKYNGVDVATMSAEEILEAEAALRTIQGKASDVVFDSDNLNVYLQKLIVEYTKEYESNRRQIEQNDAIIQQLKRSKVPSDAKRKSKIEAENVSLKARNLELNQSLRDMNSSEDALKDIETCGILNGYRIEIARILQFIQELNVSLQNKKQEEENLQDSINQTQSAINDCGKELEELKLDEKYTENNLLQFQISSAKISNLNIEIEAFQIQKAQVEASKQNLQNELDDLNRRLIALKNDIETLDKETEKTKKDYDDRITLTQEQIDSYKDFDEDKASKELSDLQANLSSKNETLNSKIDAINNFTFIELEVTEEDRAIYEENQLGLSELRSELSSLQADLLNFTTNKDMLESVLYQKQQLIILTAQLKSYEDIDIPDKETRIEEIQNQIAALNTELIASGYIYMEIDQVENAIKEDEEMIASSEKKIEDKQKEIDNYEIIELTYSNQEEYNQNREEYNNLINDRDELNQEIEELENRIELFTEMLNQSIYALDYLNTSLSELKINKESFLSNQEEQKKILQDNSSSMVSSITGINDEIESYNSTLNNYNSTINSLRTSLNSHNNILRKLNLDISVENVPEYLTRINEYNSKTLELENLQNSLLQSNERITTLQLETRNINKNMQEKESDIKDNKNNITDIVKNLITLDKEKVLNLIESNNYSNVNFINDCYELLNSQINLSSLVTTKIINITDVTPIYKTTNSQVKLSTISPYFTLIDTRANKLMEISDSEYYLQTSGFQQATNEDGSGGKGIKLDLMNSKLTGYNFILKSAMSNYSNSDDPDADTESAAYYNGSYITLSSFGTSTNPFFRVFYKTQDLKTGIKLIDITRDSFVMHSQNWISGTSGMEFDLVRGTLKAYTGFDLYAKEIKDGKENSINFSSSGNPFLRILNQNVPLMNITTTAFTLQSQNYSNAPGEEDGILLDLGRGSSFTAFNNFKLYTKVSSGDYQGSYFRLNTSQTAGVSLRFYYQKNGMPNKPLDLLRIDPTNNIYLLQSQDWNNNNAGVQLNMATGKLNAYKFTIKAFRSGKTNQYIKLDSTAESYPFQVVGDDTFRIHWDGSVTAPRLTATKSGSIGPFKFDNQALWTQSKTLGGSGIYLGASGKAGFSISDKFVVQGNGNLETTGSAYFGGSLVTQGTTYINGNLHITGKIIGNNWQVEGNGSAPSGTGGQSASGYTTASRGSGSKFTTGNLQAKGGVIAGWKINEKTLSSSNNKIILDPTKDKENIQVGTIKILNKSNNSGEISFGKSAFIMCVDTESSDTLRLWSNNILLACNKRLEMHCTDGIKLGAVDTINSTKTFTGTITFSDGSYLKVQYGMITGGKVEGGTEFKGSGTGK